MPVQFENYAYSFLRKNTPVFVPSSKGRRIGEDLKSQIENTVFFEPYYFHFNRGGHVAALHMHRDKNYFAKTDLRRFFYSIPRNRVVKALAQNGISRPVHYAKWSTVKDPFGRSGYFVPYGFVQSPLLATLVVKTSGLGKFFTWLAGSGVTLSVYMDDICISADDHSLLVAAYNELLSEIELAKFEVSEGKCTPPSSMLNIFNCELSNLRSEVMPDRITLFHSQGPTVAAVQAFDRYCESVRS